MLCPRLARADSYALTPATAPATNPSGGTATGGDGATEGYYNDTVPYTDGLAGYGAETGASSGDDPCDCSGSVSWDFTWQPATANEPPPQSVIVVQGCAAGFTGSAGATGDGANGFGDPPVALPDGVGSVSGLDGTGDSYIPHYSTQSGGQSVSVSSVGSPHADGTADAGGGYAECWVFSTCAVYPVTITLAGQPLDGNGDCDILVGQPCLPELSGVPSACTVSNYNWTTTGNTYQSWGVSSDLSHTISVPGPGNLSTSGPSWYWVELGNDSFKTETITVTATVTPPAGQGAAFTVKATQNVKVCVPAWTCTGTGGQMQVSIINDPNGNPNNDYWLWAAPCAGTGYSNGMTWNATVSEPTGTSLGSGNLELVQIVTPDCGYTDRSRQQWVASFNNQTGLDKWYPYPPDPSAENQDGESYTSGDSPCIDLTALGAISAYNDDGFADYLLFMPNGSTSWVPLASFVWQAAGNATLPASGSWADFQGTAGIVGPAPGNDTPGSTTSFNPCDVYPSWTQVINPQASGGWTRQ